MKNLLSVAETAMDLQNVVEVKEELSRLGKWLEELFPRMMDFILQIALAFVFIIIGMKLIKWVRKILT